MFSSSMLSTVVLVALSMTARVSAHGGFSPALGVSGTFVRADVQRVVAGSDCGSTNVAANIDTSTAIPADPTTGVFTVTGNSFDAGSDGSLQATAVADTTGTGTAFNTDVAITQNGNAVQTSAASTQQLVASLPAGTTCKGGKAGNLCVVAFKTSAGFQNCVVVSQGAASSSTAAASTGASNSTAASTVAASNNAGAATVAASTNGTTAATTPTTGTAATGAKKVKKVKLTAAEKAAKKAAKAAKKAAKAAAAGGAAAGAAATGAAATVAAAAGGAAATVAATGAASTGAAVSGRSIGGSRAARAARAGLLV